MQGVPDREPGPAFGIVDVAHPVMIAARGGGARDPTVGQWGTGSDAGAVTLEQ